MSKFGHPGISKFKHHTIVTLLKSLHSLTSNPAAAKSAAAVTAAAAAKSGTVARKGTRPKWETVKARRDEEESKTRVRLRLQKGERLG